MAGPAGEADSGALRLDPPQDTEFYPGFVVNALKIAASSGECGLKRIAAVRLERERLQMRCMVEIGQTRGLGHRARDPVGGGGRHHPLSSSPLRRSSIPDLTRRRGRSRRQARQSFNGKPPAPRRRCDTGDPKRRGILRDWSCQRHDFGAHRVGTRDLPATRPRLNLTRSAASNAIRTASSPHSRLRNRPRHARSYDVASMARYFRDRTRASWWAPDRHWFLRERDRRGVATVLTAILAWNSAKPSNR